MTTHQIEEKPETYWRKPTAHENRIGRAFGQQVWRAFLAPGAVVNKHCPYRDFSGENYVECLEKAFAWEKDNKATIHAMFQVADDGFCLLRPTSE